VTSPPDEVQAAAPSGPAEDIRVSTLEIFFDLVFAFTLTQLTAMLAADPSWLTGIRVLLVFGLLWWMYQGYAWLTNTRPPVHTTERLLLLTGMAGFLVVGLAIPRGFAGSGVELGLGYLLVVLVHAVLYYRVNANIVRVAPFSIASALLVTAAGVLHGPHGTTSLAGYVLWVAALAIQLGSPLIVHPGGLFELRPGHFCERHSALLIVAIGESVAAVGIGAAGPVTWRLLGSAILGLAAAAALWWIIFGSGDEERAEQVMTAASPERRVALALSAFFYGNIPLLLGLVGTAAGILRAIEYATGRDSAVLGSEALAAQAATMACGAALFLAGAAILRRHLRTGPVLARTVAAGAALATTAVGTFAGLNAQLVMIVAIFATALTTDRPEPTPLGSARAHAWRRGSRGRGRSGRRRCGRIVP
jgi:low temperature requirement protein LtrA